MYYEDQQGPAQRQRHEAQGGHITLKDCLYV